MKGTYAVTALLTLNLSASAYAQPTNFGFETGDTTGWVESYPDVEKLIPNIKVLTNLTERGASYSPVDGNYFAVLGSGDDAAGFAMLSQVIALKGGDKLEGWATFCCGSEVYVSESYERLETISYNDYALISILNSQGQVVAEPWYADSYDLGYFVINSQYEIIDSVAFGQLPWQHWSWTASKAGNYTLEYYTAQGGDWVEMSYALFDGPRSKSTAVPEPATMAMLGLVLGVIAFTRRFLA